MKKFLLIFLFLLLFLLLFLTFKKQKQGYWFCQNNQWQKIGQPPYPKPKVSCPKKINLPGTQDECLKQNRIWKNGLWRQKNLVI